MDLLQQVIAQKRKQIDSLTIQNSNGCKMLKRSDLFNKEKDAFIERLKANETHRLGGDNIAFDIDKSLEESSSKVELARFEVIRRLRARGHPIRLFAESDKDALRRLRRSEMEQPELNEGWQNEFQNALKKVENEEMEEVIKGTKDEAGKHDVLLTETEGDATWEQIHNRAPLLGEGNDVNRDCDVIKDFLNYLLKRWGRELNSRDEAVKRSPIGKLESGTHKQTLENLRPLMRSLDKYSVNNDIRHHLINICRLCIVDRNYIVANNAYMEMAIGNAPWPVGVTRSGIHQRPGSSKAYVSNIAHVLNDETQRKYIHGVKRLMSKCQQFFPSDPSKCVEYVKMREAEPEEPEGNRNKEL